MKARPPLKYSPLTKFEKRRHTTVLLWEQEDRCPICDKRCGSPRLDHDHVTDYVRGVLCNDHNMALGKFHDDAAELRRAADYLEKHRRRIEDFVNDMSDLSKYESGLRVDFSANRILFREWWKD